jgi:hypothetical protein
MDFRLFVESLTLAEMNTLSMAIHEKRTLIANQYTEPLSNDERDLVGCGEWIKAIKSYRNRNNCDLLTAKVKVDDYRDKLHRLLMVK